MDVVANNVANVNTNGYKADKSLFQEYLRTGAREDNFIGSDRAVSFVLDRGSYRDFTQGSAEQTKNPLDVTIDGGGFLVVQTAAGERYTRDGGLQINNQGQLVTANGDAVLGTNGPIVSQPTAISASSKAPPGPTRCAASCGSSASRTRSSFSRKAPTFTRPVTPPRSPTRHRESDRASSRSPTSARLRK